MIMVDWKTKSAKDMGAIYKAQGVQISGPALAKLAHGRPHLHRQQGRHGRLLNATGKILA